MSRPLTKAEADRANEMRALNATPYRIGQSLRVSTDSVRLHFGLPPTRPMLTAEEENEIRRLFADGVARDVVCERFRIGKSRAADIRKGVTRAERARRKRKLKVAVIQVPKWVPDALTSLYLNVAERDGEEAAASACRALKNSNCVRASAHAGSRLPAVVSPAGCA